MTIYSFLTDFDTDFDTCSRVGERDPGRLCGSLFARTTGTHVLSEPALQQCQSLAEGQPHRKRWCPTTPEAWL
jgi:hypothetical protein